MALTLENLSLPKRLSDISLHLRKGEMLGLIGPNGSGKSSLLKCIAGLLPHQAKLHFGGLDSHTLSSTARARYLGYLPQAASSAWALTVADIIGLGRLPWRDERPDLVQQAAQQVGVDKWLKRPISQLSGGEQARVWLARALAGEPQVLLADEPIASLDLYYQRQIMQCLRERAQGQRAVLVALHDLNLAARYCDRLCLLHQGRIHALGTPAQVLTDQHLQQVFGVSLSALRDSSLPSPQGESNGV